MASSSIVITGMHRSGTSLTARILQKAGVHIGENLVGPEPDNTNGFYEDTDLVDFHKRLLGRRGQALLTESLEDIGPFTPQETEDAKGLIRNRSTRPVWGWKDPRTTLFLNHWHELLNCSSFYVLLYRHPLNVILSLLRRGTDSAVLKDPMVAVRAWQVYNQAILTFCRQSQDICLLADVSAVVEDIPGFVETVTGKSGVSLDVDKAELEHCYYPDEFSQLYLHSEGAALLEKIIPDAMELYSQLEALASLPSTDFTSVKTPRCSKNPKLKRIADQLPGSGPLNHKQQSESLSSLLQTLAPETFLSSQKSLEILKLETKLEHAGRLKDRLFRIERTLAWRLARVAHKLLRSFKNIIERTCLQRFWKNVPKCSEKADTPAQKRVTFALPSGMTIGGVATWSIEMARRLDGLNQAVTLVRYPDTIAGFDVHLPPGIGPKYCACPVVPTKANLLQSIPAYLDLMPAVVIPNYHVAPYAACTCLSINDAEHLRVIGVCHADQPYYYALLKYYEPIIHAFVAVSHEIAEKLKFVVPHRKDDIFIRPCGVDAPELLQRDYAERGAPLRLTYAGRLAEVQKRIMDLVKLARSLAELNVDFELRIIGDGPEEEDLKKSIMMLDPSIRDRIIFAGSFSPDKMRAQWHNSDVVVLVSEYEGTSISMMEGMAHGCVPVVTDVSGTGDLITDGVNGYLVRVGDMEGMAQRIKDLDVERERLHEMGKESHARVLAQCSYDKYVPDFLDLVNKTWDMPPRQWPRNRHPVLSALNLWILERRLSFRLKMKTSSRGL